MTDNDKPQESTSPADNQAKPAEGNPVTTFFLILLKIAGAFAVLLILLVVAFFMSCLL